MKKEKFNWGESSDWYRTQINHEIFDKKMYEKYSEVEEGDIILVIILKIIFL